MNIFNWFQKSKTPQFSHDLTQNVRGDRFAQFESFISTFVQSQQPEISWPSLLWVHGDAFLRWGDFPLLVLGSSVSYFDPLLTHFPVTRSCLGIQKLSQHYLNR